MNIAVLGASFDPSHNGHLAIARNVLKSQKVNKVILMPVNIHPFAKELTPLRHRLAMAKLLEEENIEVSDWELKKNSTSYSIETLQALRKNFTKDRLYWIIGSDSLESFTKWKDAQKIISDFGLIIVARNTAINIAKEVKKLVNNVFEENIIILNAKNFPPIDVSSSEIKKKIKIGKSITNLVPKEVESYIIRNKLYA